MIKHVVLFKFKQGTAQTKVDELMRLQYMVCVGLMATHPAAYFRHALDASRIWTDDATIQLG